MVISTPQAVALADVRRSVSMFQKASVPILGIVENMAEFVCPACGHVEAIFGHGGAEDEASLLKLPFLGRIPLEPSIRKAGDDGKPVTRPRRQRQWPGLPDPSWCSGPTGEHGPVGLSHWGC